MVTVTVPIWLFVVSAVVIGFALMKLSWMLTKWSLRDGPLKDETCPVCNRPHDSEARRLQRQLARMHENYQRLECEYEVLKAYACGTEQK